MVSFATTRLIFCSLLVISVLLLPSLGSMYFNQKLKICNRKYERIQPTLNDFVYATQKGTAKTLASGEFVDQAKEMHAMCTGMVDCLAKLHYFADQETLNEAQISLRLDMWNPICKTFEFYSGPFSQCIGKIHLNLAELKFDKTPVDEEECVLTDTEMDKLSSIVKKMCGEEAVLDMKEHELRVKNALCSVTF